MIRVLIAEDQAMVRGALASLLGLEEDIEVVAEVERGDRVTRAARSTRPDVALIDSRCRASTGYRSPRSSGASCPTCAS
jgi:two-component system response regulator DesR